MVGVCSGKYSVGFCVTAWSLVRAAHCKHGECVGSLCRVPVSGLSRHCSANCVAAACVTVCRVPVSGVSGHCSADCVAAAWSLYVRSLCRSMCRVCRVAVSVMSGVSCQTAGCVGPFSISPGSVTAFLRLLNLGQCTISRISPPASF